MAECPFCRSSVHDDADVCRSCNAEKVTTFKGHLDRAARAMGPACGMLFMFIGLPIGLLIGMGVGSVLGSEAGVICGLIGAIIVGFSPAILKAAFICRKRKVSWYR